MQCLRLLTASLLAGVCGLISSASLASVVCSNGDSAPAIDTGFRPSAGIPGGPAVDVSIPRPPACNAATFVQLIGGPLWSWKGGGTAAGGDTIDWSDSWINGFGRGQVVLDPDDGLSGLVTPVSPLATTTLDVSGEILSPNLAQFTVDWMGSDAGTAQRLRWYEYSGTIPSDFSGDNTELPDWDSLSTLLLEEIRIGPWDEVRLFDIVAVDVDNIILATNGIAVSIVSEPNAIGILGISGLGLMIYTRQYRRRFRGETVAPLN